MRTRTQQRLPCEEPKDHTGGMVPLIQPRVVGIRRELRTRPIDVGLTLISPLWLPNPATPPVGNPSSGIPSCLVMRVNKTTRGKHTMIRTRHAHRPEEGDPSPRIGDIGPCDGRPTLRIHPSFCLLTATTCSTAYWKALKLLNAFTSLQSRSSSSSPSNRSRTVRTKRGQTRLNMIIPTE